MNDQVDRSSRVRRLIVAAGLAVFAGTASAPSVAQVGPPIRLTPAPRSESPSPAAPPSDALAPARPAVPGAAGIAVERLPPVDISAIGLIDEQSGGLSSDIWARSEGSTIDRVLALLPGAWTSPAARRLAYQLFATAAEPPASASSEAERRQRAATGFLGERAARLLAMGEGEAARELVGRVPARSGEESVARVGLDAYWLAGNVDAACDHVRREIVRFSTVYWQKSLTFCQMTAGERDRAQLGLNMLREQKEEDPLFVRLLFASGGTSPGRGAPAGPIDVGRDVPPLYLATARAAKQPLPPALLNSGNAAVVAALAQDAGAPLELRLAAAERALAFGALPPAVLGQLYEQVELKPDQIANALSLSESDTTPRGRALLWRAAKGQTLPVARAEAIARALKLSRERGLYPTVSRLMRFLVTNVPPSAETAWFAPEAARLFLYLGEIDAAREWHQLLRTQALGNPQAAAEVAKLEPLMWIADGAIGSLAGEPIKAWRAARERERSPALAVQLSMLATLFNAVADPSENVFVAGLGLELKPQSVNLPDPALLALMKTASFDARTGETALLALALLGANGPSGASPYLVGPVIEALRQTGLGDHGRAFALEAAVAAGI